MIMMVENNLALLKFKLTPRKITPVIEFSCHNR